MQFTKAIASTIRMPAAAASSSEPAPAPAHEAAAEPEIGAVTMEITRDVGGILKLSSAYEQGAAAETKRVSRKSIRRVSFAPSPPKHTLALAPVPQPQQQQQQQPQQMAAVSPANSRLSTGSSRLSSGSLNGSFSNSAPGAMTSDLSLTQAIAVKTNAVLSGLQNDKTAELPRHDKMSEQTREVITLSVHFGSLN